MPITYRLRIAHEEARKHAEANRLSAAVYQAMKKRDARYRQSALANTVELHAASWFTER